MNVGAYPIAATELPRMNLLCLDGGSSTALQIRMLEYLEQEVPGFLRNTDLFAGSSDGCLIGLYLASRLGKEPDLEVIRGAVRFSNEMIPTFSVSCADLVKFAAGFWPLISLLWRQRANAFTDLVERRIGDATLGDLDERGIKVLMLSIGLKSKRPKVFQNFDPHRSDPSLKLADIALASSATPLLLPLPQLQISSDGDCDWFLDGSLAANNPSMTALASAAEYLEAKASAARRSPGRSLGHVTVASLGACDVDPRGHEAAEQGPHPRGENVGPLVRGLACLYNKLRFITAHGDELDWGWFQWLFNQDFDIANLIGFGWFQDAIDLADLQCRRLLPPRQYHRYSVGLREADLMSRLLFGDPEKLREQLDDRAKRLSESARFKRFVVWAKEHWMPRTEAPGEPAAVPDPERAVS
ncbi:patatin-like phospholipase family protein [Sorangium sp. So ce375]|uniref:patatin-like phospholipase family protein n=1 Tax=Sorangium sp. So ce375 TaxID=3133306 RepID=UPI003F5C2409